MSVGFCGLWAHTSHAQATRGAVAPQEAAARHFVRTASGDWETTITRDDGTEVTYTYVPSTKIEPEIVANIARGPMKAKFVYQYELINRSSAQQQLAVLFIKPTNPVRVNALPPNWVNESFPGDRHLILRGPLDGEAPSGVPPGESLGGLVLEAPVLPGIGKVASRGNTSGAVEVPDGLSSAQYLELVEISKKSTVDVPAILPSIGAGVGEPTLGLGPLLARIGGNYVSGFFEYEHPHAAALEKAFRGVYGTGDELSDPKRQQALNRVLEISQLPVKYGWHQQMSAALELCMRAVLDGVVPDNRPVRPEDLGQR
ncbi:MAG: hypothetical protein GEU99_09020 [Luteitalea sp.]|nr:hypothetical protein [Luteitalea sp.]